MISNLNKYNTLFPKKFQRSRIGNFFNKYVIKEVIKTILKNNFFVRYLIRGHSKF